MLTFAHNNNNNDNGNENDNDDNSYNNENDDDDDDDDDLGHWVSNSLAISKAWMLGPLFLIRLLYTAVAPDLEANVHYR